MAAKEDNHDGSCRHGSLAARKIRGRLRHGTELESRSRRETSTWPSSEFSRSEGKIRIPPQLQCFSRSKSYLLVRGFQGSRMLIQKRKLFPDLPTASPGHFELPQRTLLRGPELYAIPLPGSKIRTGFRFVRRACVSLLFAEYTRVYTRVSYAVTDIGFLLGLRID